MGKEIKGPRSYDGDQRKWMHRWCSICNQTFDKGNGFEFHKKVVHKKEKHICGKCSQPMLNKASLVAQYIGVGLFLFLVF